MKVINYRALPIFFICMIMAIILAVFVDPLASLILAIVALGGVVLCFFTPKLRKYLLRSIMITMALIIAVAVTWLDIYFREEFNAVSADESLIVGKIDALTQFDDEGYVLKDEIIIVTSVKYTLEDGIQRKTMSKVLLKGVLVGDKQYKIGEILTVKGSMETVKVEPTNHFDIRNYRENIGYISDVHTIVIILPSKPTFFDSIKLKTKSLLSKNTSDERGVTGLVYSMLFGDKSMLSPVVKGEFAATGLSHLFAVSGLHVGMIALIVVYILRKLKANHWIQFLVLSVFLGGYSFLCGFSPSVMRASIMILIATLSKALGYRNDSISTLSFSAIVILIFRPFYLFDLSFLMTFFAILGIVLLNKPIYNKLTFAPKFIAEPLAVLLSVNIGLFPIIMCYFGSLSLLFGVANIIILPIIAIAYPLIFIAIVISLALPFMGFLITPVGWMFELVAMIVKLISNVPFVTMRLEYTLGFVVVWPIIMVFLSEYILIKPKMRNIIATSAIIVYFIATTITTVCLSNTAIIKTVSYNNEERGYYHLEYRDENYFVVNSDIDEYGLSRLTNYLSYNGIRKIKSLIIADASAEDIISLRKLRSLSTVEHLITQEFSESYRDYWDINYTDYYHDNYMDVNFVASGAILIEVEKSRVLFEGGGQLIPEQNNAYDLIYTDLLTAALNTNTKFIVNQQGSSIDKLNNNVLSNDFTFAIKNGKIRVGRK